MRNRNRRRIGALLMCLVFLSATGCQKALREGIMAGVTDGVAGLIESWITSSAATALDAAWLEP